MENLTAHEIVESLLEDALLEKKKKGKPSTSGVYADFSAGREKPVYTCKCPNTKCGVIHGSFKSKAEAMANRHCRRCRVKNAGKFKKEIEKVDKPEKPKQDHIKRTSKNIIESMDDDDMSTKDFMRQNSMPLKDDQVDKNVCINARYGQEFYHKQSGSRVRVTGKCRAWKTRPEEFQLPVKFGLYKSLYIDNRNAGEWSTKPVDKPDARTLKGNVKPPRPA